MHQAPPNPLNPQPSTLNARKAGAILQALTTVLLCFVAGAAVAASSIPGWPGELVKQGKGEDESRWYSEPIPVESNQVYALTFEMKLVGNGRAVVGTDAINKDITTPMRDWTQQRIVFRTRTDRKTERIHFGQWKLNGTASFRNPRLERVTCVHAEEDGLTLGAGEQLDGGTYRYTASLSSFACNESAPLFAARKVTYNSMSWVFGSGSEVIYRHALPGRRMVSAALRVGCSSYRKGRVAVEVSADGATWTTLGALTNLSEFACAVPPALLPAEAVFVRLMAGEGVNLHVNDYSFDAELAGEVRWMTGTTRYLSPSGEDLGGTVRSSYFDEDYGETVAATDAVSVWRATSNRKIPPSRKIPAARADALEIKTAANEAEAAQLVVSPHVALEDVRLALAGDLVAADSASRLSAGAVDLLRVGYVEIQRPSDAAGLRGLWPDPLPPQDDAPLAVAAKRSQPFWVRVKPPKGTPKGLYRGAIEVSGRTVAGAPLRISVPFEVEVFGFELPDRMTCSTAFRCAMTDPWRYHAAKTPDERQKIADRYFDAIAACHISPYDPVPGIDWRVALKDGKVEFDWSAWDAAIEKAIATRHINTIKLKVEGLGGGSFHSRREPSFLGVPATNAAYQVLMAQYLGGLESHFRSKGWQDLVWTFWFDEPAAKDYPFVMEGFRMLRRHAPGLWHMLTEQPEPALYGGPNLWCGIPSEMDMARVAERHAAGERVWWYLCVSPKAPYVGLFIDHPANDLRIWLWQTWGENVTGVLSWNTCCWSSRAAYPNPKEPQNPYRDPMSWMYSYGLPPGARRPWGNGDGRLFYPPLALADGKATTFTEGDPVASFRSEGLRDGIEDYEYFAILKRLDPKSPLLKVPADVYRSLTDFSKDPTAMEQHRVKLARAIESNVAR